MSTLKLKKKVAPWRKHFAPGEKVDKHKVTRLMKAQYPTLFAEVRPLAIGVHKKILNDPELPVTKKQARLFLERWTRRPKYMSMRDRGEPRADLDLEGGRE